MPIFPNYWLCLLLSFFSVGTFAAVTPSPSAKDPRIQHVLYDPDDVVNVNAAKGVSILVVLAHHEKIEESSTGFRSDCKSDAGAEWCIVAKKGDNKFWVKPFSTGAFIDLQLVTDHRIYSFAFNAGNVPTASNKSPTYRVVFDYPLPPVVEKPSTSIADLITPQVLEMMKDKQAMALAAAPEKLVRKNIEYTMQVVGKSDAIAPAEAFDDGRFTYFRFPANREVPSIFTISGEGVERQVPTHWVKGTDYLAVEKVLPRFIFRKDNETVGVWNEAFDANGLPAVDGTTVENLKRVVK